MVAKLANAITMEVVAMGTRVSIESRFAVNTNIVAAKDGLSIGTFDDKDCVRGIELVGGDCHPIRSARVEVIDLRLATFKAVKTLAALRKSLASAEEQKLMFDEDEVPEWVTSALAQIPGNITAAEDALDKQMGPVVVGLEVYLENGRYYVLFRDTIWEGVPTLSFCTHSARVQGGQYCLEGRLPTDEVVKYYLRDGELVVLAVCGTVRRQPRGGERACDAPIAGVLKLMTWDAVAVKGSAIEARANSDGTLSVSVQPIQVAQDVVAKDSPSSEPAVALTPAAVGDAIDKLRSAFPRLTPVTQSPERTQEVEVAPVEPTEVATTPVEVALPPISSKEKRRRQLARKKTQKAVLTADSEDTEPKKETPKRKRAKRGEALVEAIEKPVEEPAEESTAAQEGKADSMTA